MKNIEFGLEMQISDFRTLSDLGKQKIYKPLGESIFEFRIPPRTKGRVVRVYFTFSRTE